MIYEVFKIGFAENETRVAEIVVVFVRLVVDVGKDVGIVALWHSLLGDCLLEAGANCYDATVVILYHNLATLGVLLHTIAYAYGNHKAECAVVNMLNPCELRYDTSLAMSGKQFCCFVT